MKQLTPERIAELEMEAAKVYPATYEVDGVRYDDNIHITKRNAWLSCAKSYELKLMENDDFIVKLKQDIEDFYGDELEMKREITRLKGLIEKAFYSFEFSVKSKDSLWDKFKTDNQL